MKGGTQEMIRGVNFLAIRDKFMLQRIFKDLNVEEFHWYNILSQNEVWGNTRGGITLDNEYYDGKTFAQSINAEHYIIFLKLQAYYEIGGYFDIHTYDDFQRSDCQLLLLICDNIYVDIYAKDQAVIKTIYETALANNYTDVKYISENNDFRYKMDIR